MELFANNKTFPLECFERLAAVTFSEDKDDSYILKPGVEEVCTDHLVLRGKYSALSVCCYGTVVDDEAGATIDDGLTLFGVDALPKAGGETFLFSSDVLSDKWRRLKDGEKKRSAYALPVYAVRPYQVRRHSVLGPCSKLMLTAGGLSADSDMHKVVDPAVCYVAVGADLLP